MPGSASPGRSSPDAAAALIWSTSWRKTGPPDLKETRNCMARVSLIGQGGDGVKRFVGSGPARADLFADCEEKTQHRGHRVRYRPVRDRARDLRSRRKNALQARW